MRKSVLKLLGKILQMQEACWNLAAERRPDASQKYKLACTLRRSLENQQRGLKKSKLDYIGASERLLELGPHATYSELHTAVTVILFGSPT